MCTVILNRNKCTSNAEFSYTTNAFSQFLSGAVLNHFHLSENIFQGTIRKKIARTIRLNNGLSLFQVVTTHLQYDFPNPNVEVMGSNPSTCNHFLVRENGIITCFSLKQTFNSVFAATNYPFLRSFLRCTPFSQTVSECSIFRTFSRHPLDLRPLQK